MTRTQKLTNELLYSWDEGLTWETYKYNSHAIDVQKIRAGPSELSKAFIIEGIHEQKSVLWFVDFSKVLKPECNYIFVDIHFSI